jgi:hypothetical protein
MPGDYGLMQLKAGGRGLFREVSFICGGDSHVIIPCFTEYYDNVWCVVMAKLHHLLLFLLLFALITTACADVGFDRFRVDVEDDDIDVGDSIEVILEFEDPDNTETADLEVEIKVDGITVFQDEDFEVAFTEGEDKTVTIDSGDFPGPDLDHDFWNSNLMDRICGQFEIEVFVGGRDVEDDVDDDVTFTIGEDDDVLTFTVDPEIPRVGEEILVTVFDEDGDELEDAEFKITWLDDPDGDEDGEWDSEDAYWEDDTDDDGEVDFTLEDEFGDGASGLFQLDVYDRHYCLTRKTLDVSRELTLNITSVVQAGQAFNVCVRDAAGEGVDQADVYVYGPGHSKSYKTAFNGCVGLTINTLGSYRVSASKSGYISNIDNAFTVAREQPTTTSTTIASTTTVPTKPRALMILTPKLTVYVGDVVGVKVEDEGGNPVEGAVVSALPLDESGATDDLGTYRFTPEAPGTYQVKAEKSGYLPAQKTIMAIERPQETPGAPVDEEEAGEKEEGPQVIPSFVRENWVILAVILAALIFAAAASAVLMAKPRKPPGKELFPDRKGSQLGGKLEQ